MAESLRTLVLKGRLKTPVQQGFLAEAWDTALRAIASPSDEDLRIYQVAKFIGEQSQALRQRLKSTPPPTGSLVNMVRRAIGCVNREFLLVLNNTASMDTDGPIYVSDIIQKELELSGGINTATPQELIESAVDGLRFEIAALGSGKIESVELPKNQTVRRIFLRGNLSVFYHILEEEWLDGLHHGWMIDTTLDGYSLFFPSNRESAIDLSVGQYRDNALIAESAGRAIHALKTDPRLQGRGKFSGVVRIGAGKKKTYKSIEMSDELSTEVFTAMLLAADPDLVPFSTVPLPNLGYMTARELLDVWAALIQLAQDIGTRMPFNEEINHINQLERFAPLENAPSLIVALAKSTGLPKQKCAIAIDLFTWRDVRDGLWHRPLVKVGEHGDLIVILPVLKSANLRRSIEYWLSEGGLDLAERGDAYENYVRREISGAIDANTMLSSHSGVVKIPIRPSDSSIGDIDLLFWIGTTICIGEIKCLLRPGTSHERFQYNDRIYDAANQVKRKAAYLIDNLIVLCSAYNIPINPASDVTVVPIVILNSPIGATRMVQEIPVLDIYILKRYLDRGFAIMYASAEDDSAGIRVPFYDDAAQAASNLGEYLKDPVHIRVYRESVEWKTQQQPDFVRENSHVLRIFPNVRVQEPHIVAGGRLKKS